MAMCMCIVPSWVGSWCQKSDCLLDPWLVLPIIVAKLFHRTNVEQQQ
jgi:hypothetical protein